MIATPTRFTAVYGPVQSWRFGRSLGIDPIGAESTCSFSCVYCQLGEIENPSCQRQLFVSTEQICQELQQVPLSDVDCVTLSGSGEPTLALNLGEIIIAAKALTQKPVAVLTNGSLLIHPAVREELAIADQVAVKLDAIQVDQFTRINRPVSGTDLMKLWASLLRFRRVYSGHLAIQTMLLTPWTDDEQEEYITLMRDLIPDVIQLNTPTRAKPTTHHLEARANHQRDEYPYAGHFLKPVSSEALEIFAERIQSMLAIPVHFPRSLDLP